MVIDIWCKKTEKIDSSGQSYKKKDTPLVFSCVLVCCVLFCFVLSSKSYHHHHEGGRNIGHIEAFLYREFAKMWLQGMPPHRSNP